jgi:ABC-type sugar transport system ATPase subunit
MSIEIKNLVKRFGDTTAVNGVSLTIEDGEFFVLLGPSGCGKTTTLRMIAGLELASEGQILINGRDVTYLEPRHRDIAMAFQDYGLYPHMSVANNIAFPLKIRKVDPAQRERKVRDTAEKLGIAGLLDRKPAQISGGERQRVSLARALVREPSVFLMDEPLSNLDAKLRAVMRTEIKKLVSHLGITTVYVTHDQIEAMAMADRIGIMNKGDMVQVGYPLEIYDRPADRFVAEFVGSPPMNLVEAKVETGRKLSCPLTHLAASIPAAEKTRLDGALEPGSDVTIGVRPEHLVIDADDGAEGDAAAIELIEPLGQLTNVYLATQGGRMISVVDRIQMNVGDSVKVRAIPDHIRLITA